MNSKRKLHSSAMRLLAELCSGSREDRSASSVASLPFPSYVNCGYLASPTQL
jgi:hypothetical protein